MSLRECIYSILIVSATDNFTSAFTGLLSELRYSPVHTVTSISAARRILAEKTFDFVIINDSMPDGMSAVFATDICTAKQTAVLLFVQRDMHADIHDRVSRYGVFTLPKPVSKSIIIHALSWMESYRERLRLFEKKSISIEDKMTEIRLVNKAKWILIRECSMSEPESHRYIEKQAMDRCISKRSIAEEIIKTYT